MPTPIDYAPRPLKRQVGLFGAVLLGLGSMIGTGVFIGLGQATEIAGPWVLVAVLIAAGLALCNALSSAQLAAVFPVAGGTYEYGYRTLTPALGFTAGWTFLLAKTASAATAAMGVGWAIKLLFDSPNVNPRASDLVQPNLWQVLSGVSGSNRGAVVVVSTAAVALLTTAVLAGLRRSNHLNAMLLLVTLVGLGAVLVGSAGTVMRIWQDDPTGQIGLWITITEANLGSRLSSVLQASAITFVVFTGYGRLATLGEEVIAPSVTIPRAIAASLSMVTLLAAIVAVWLVAADCMPFGSFTTSLTTERLLGYIDEGRRWPFQIALFVAAITAMLGVLLNLILGLSRVWLAMGRRGDMPAWLAYVSPSGSPAVAVIVAGGFIAIMAMVGNVRLTWSFSAFSVLIYYAITNLAALRLPREQRRYPRILAWIGLSTCAGLAWFVDREVWVAGTIAIGLGLVWHAWRGRFRRSATPIA